MLPCHRSQRRPGRCVHSRLLRPRRRPVPQATHVGAAPHGRHGRGNALRRIRRAQDGAGRLFCRAHRPQRMCVRAGAVGILPNLVYVASRALHKPTFPSFTPHRPPAMQTFESSRRYRSPGGPSCRPTPPPFATRTTSTRTAMKATTTRGGPGLQRPLPGTQRARAPHPQRGRAAEAAAAGTPLLQLCRRRLRRPLALVLMQTLNFYPSQGGRQRYRGVDKSAPQPSLRLLLMPRFRGRRRRVVRRSSACPTWLRKDIKWRFLSNPVSSLL